MITESGKGLDAGSGAAAAPDHGRYLATHDFTSITRTSKVPWNSYKEGTVRPERLC
jgi:hypothetical protein